MSAGTLTLTNNSAAVAGSGTAFTTEVAAGDFIVVTVGGVPYTLPIKSVESGTALTLVSNFTGPTQAGAAWSAVPRMALNMVTAALVAQSAEALRGLNYDKQNWQSIFSGTGTSTVRLPDGSSFTGPSWGSINTELSYKLEKQKNLSDLPDKTIARESLQLGHNDDVTFAFIRCLQVPKTMGVITTATGSVSSSVNIGSVIWISPGQWRVNFHAPMKSGYLPIAGIVADTGPSGTTAASCTLFSADNSGFNIAVFDTTGTDFRNVSYLTVCVYGDYA